MQLCLKPMCLAVKILAYLALPVVICHILFVADAYLPTTVS